MVVSHLSCHLAVNVGDSGLRILGKFWENCAHFFVVHLQHTQFCFYGTLLGSPMFMV